MKSKVFVILCCALGMGNTMAALAAQCKHSDKGDRSNYQEDSQNRINFTKFQQYLPYFQAGGTGFFNVNRSKAATGLDLFMPLLQTTSQQHLLFSHLRLFDRTGKAFEGNAHLGYRHLVPAREHIYGIYGAFDRKKSDFGNYFNQLTLGMEGWFKKLFVGGNLYYPLGDRSKLVAITNERADYDRVQNNIWITRDSKHEKAMGGGDGEVGYELLEGLVGYAGGYYFKANNIESICGPRARLTYDWSLDHGKILNVFDKIGLELGVQHDAPRGTTYYAHANLRIGLSTQETKLRGVAKHMADLVRRDPDIVSSATLKQDREIYRDDLGKEVRVRELLGNEQGLVDAAEFRQILQDEETKVVLLRGRVENLDTETKDPIFVKGTKKLVLDNKIYINSPSTGKRMEVQLNGASGNSALDKGTLAASVKEELARNNEIHIFSGDLSEENFGATVTTVDGMGFMADGENFHLRANPLALQKRNSVAEKRVASPRLSTVAQHRRQELKSNNGLNQGKIVQSDSPADVQDRQEEQQPNGAVNRREVLNSNAVESKVQELSDTTVSEIPGKNMEHDSGMGLKQKLGKLMVLSSTAVTNAKEKLNGAAQHALNIMTPSEPLEVEVVATESPRRETMVEMVAGEDQEVATMSAKKIDRFRQVGEKLSSMANKAMNIMTPAEPVEVGAVFTNYLQGRVALEVAAKGEQMLIAEPSAAVSKSRSFGKKLGGMAKQTMNIITPPEPLELETVIAKPLQDEAMKVAVTKVVAEGESTIAAEFITEANKPRSFGEKLGGAAKRVVNIITPSEPLEIEVVSAKSVQDEAMTAVTTKAVVEGELTVTAESTTVANKSRSFGKKLGSVVKQAVNIITPPEPLELETVVAKPLQDESMKAMATKVVAEGESMVAAKSITAASKSHSFGEKLGGAAKRVVNTMTPAEPLEIEAVSANSAQDEAMKVAATKVVAEGESAVIAEPAIEVSSEDRETVLPAEDNDSNSDTIAAIEKKNLFGSLKQILNTSDPLDASPAFNINFKTAAKILGTVAGTALVATGGYFAWHKYKHYQGKKVGVVAGSAAGNFIKTNSVEVAEQAGEELMDLNTSYNEFVSENDVFRMDIYSDSEYSGSTNQAGIVENMETVLNTVTSEKDPVIQTSFLGDQEIFDLATPPASGNTYPRISFPESLGTPNIQMQSSHNINTISDNAFTNVPLDGPFFPEAPVVSPVAPSLFGSVIGTAWKGLKAFGRLQLVIADKVVGNPSDCK